LNSLPDTHVIVCLLTLALVDALHDTLDILDLLIYGLYPGIEDAEWRKIAKDSAFAAAVRS
jgi:hypothetical protein